MDKAKVNAPPEITLRLRAHESERPIRKFKLSRIAVVQLRSGADFGNKISDNNRDKMKYYVYVTNASNYNSLHKFKSLYEAKDFCKTASYHNSCYIFKGEEMKFYEREEKSEPSKVDNEPF